jgi:hypothetical protein
MILSPDNEHESLVVGCNGISDDYTPDMDQLYTSGEDTPQQRIRVRGS